MTNPFVLYFLTLNIRCYSEVLSESLKNYSTEIFGYSYLHTDYQLNILPTLTVVGSLERRWSIRRLLDVFSCRNIIQKLVSKKHNPIAVCNQLITYLQKQLKIHRSFNQLTFPFTRTPVLGNLLHLQHNTSWVFAELFTFPEPLQMPVSYISVLWS